MDKHADVREIKTVRTDEEANGLLEDGWVILEVGTSHMDGLGFNAKTHFILARLDDEREQPDSLRESEAVVDRINELKEALRAVDNWQRESFQLSVDESEGLVPAGTCHYCGDSEHNDDSCPGPLVVKALWPHKE